MSEPPFLDETIDQQPIFPNQIPLRFTECRLISEDDDFSIHLCVLEGGELIIKRCLLGDVGRNNSFEMSKDLDTPYVLAPLFKFEDEKFRYLVFEPYDMTFDDYIQTGINIQRKDLVKGILEGVLSMHQKNLGHGNLTDTKSVVIFRNKVKLTGAKGGGSWLKPLPKDDFIPLTNLLNHFWQPPLHTGLDHIIYLLRTGFIGVKMLKRICHNHPFFLTSTGRLKLMAEIWLNLTNNDCPTKRCINNFRIKLSSWFTNFNWITSLKALPSFKDSYLDQAFRHNGGAHKYQNDAWWLLIFYRHVWHHRSDPGKDDVILESHLNGISNGFVYEVYKYALFFPNEAFTALPPADRNWN